VILEEVLCLLTAQVRHRQTDRQTDRHTNRHTNGKAISIAERLVRNAR